MKSEDKAAVIAIVCLTLMTTVLVLAGMILDATS